MSLASILITGCAPDAPPDESVKVREASTKYMGARRALENDDSTLLREVTSDSLYMLIMLNHRYNRLLANEDVPILGVDLNILPASVKLFGDTATCLMNCEEHYELHLHKIGGVWKVVGENEIFPDQERMSRIEMKIAERKAFQKNKPLSDSVIKVMNAFLPGVKEYFKGSDDKEWEKFCDAPTRSFIKQLRSIAENTIGSGPLLEELNQPDYSTCEVSRKNDGAIFAWYQEENHIIVRKEKGDFIATGFNGKASGKISKAEMQRDYLKYLRALKLIRRSYYGAH